MSEPGRVRVAVIPARGGSKRVPRKNVRLLDGRPLIAWSVDTCLRSDCFDQVIVSTDDTEVAAAARSAGAQVPFMRDRELSDDHTPLVPVIADAVRRLELAESDLVCCVFPTAVGLQPDDLRAGAEIATLPSSSSYVVGVARYDHPVQRALVLGPNGDVRMLEPTLALQRTQDLEPRWHDAGQFVWGPARAWLAGVTVLTSARGIDMPAWRVIDLDTEEDWERAEVVHALLRNRLG